MDNYTNNKFIDIDNNYAHETFIRFMFPSEQIKILINMDKISGIFHQPLYTNSVFQNLYYEFQGMIGILLQ